MGEEKNREMLDWIAVSVIGRDGPGIVAAVSKALYRNDYNIEALSQIVIMGQFAMILMASAPKGVMHVKLKGDFDIVGTQLDLDINIREIQPDEIVPYRYGEMEPFVITVRGEDRPGLAYGITEVLTEFGINITNLDAKVTLLGQKPEYIQVFEVDIPKELDFGLIQERLRDRGQALGVHVDLQHRDIFRAINQI